MESLQGILIPPVMITASHPFRLMVSSRDRIPVSPWMLIALLGCQIRIVSGMKSTWVHFL